MLNPSLIESIAAGFLAGALIHVFAAPYIRKLEYRFPRHAGVFHLLSEVEVIFAFWAVLLLIVMFASIGKIETLNYVNNRNYTEPLFVFAIMIVAASAPVLLAVQGWIAGLARLLPLPDAVLRYWLLLAFVPLLGSLITEPAAMTIAALSLSSFFFDDQVKLRYRYITLATLFVNISIGGVLTSFAAPPVLMVASTWQWDSAFMFTHFGLKAIAAVLINATLATALVRSELSRKNSLAPATSVPMPITIVHFAFLVGVVYFAHEPVIFMGLLLCFVAFTQAYQRHQQRLIVREALLVACFLAGLVLLGGLQAWWLSPALQSMSPTGVYFGAIGLTAITDNAALTYLAAQAQGLSDEFKYFVVAGAVVGGGLTVIANAPNPAGVTILGKHFPDGEIAPLRLLLAALVPTFVAMVCFWF
jgi:hypothetical protein